MAYIYLHSAANETDMREFTSPFILFVVTDEGEHYCCAVAWGHFSLASGGAMGPANEPPSGVYPRWLHHNGMKCSMR